MLHLGFDAKRLFNNSTGLGNYSRTLLQNLSEYYPEHHYFLYSPKASSQPYTQDFLKNPSYTTVTPNGGIKAYWRSYGMLSDMKNKGLQLYHGLSHELPIGIEKTNIKSIVTIHDLIIKTWPQTFPWIDRKIYNYKFASSCRRADKIIAISESTKKDIVNYYQIDPKRIKVVYQTCDERFKIVLSESHIKEVLQKHQLPENYLLYVGSIIERKNLLGLLEAIRQLPKELKIPLVVIGKGDTYFKKVQSFIKQYGMDDQIFFPKKVSNDSLTAIYQGADVFCYPSLYEGFGIPIIEALFSKTPVLTSQHSSLPEAAGPGAYYANTLKADHISAGIQKILTDSNYAKQLKIDGYAYVQRFDAKKLTKEMMETYKEVLR